MISTFTWLNDCQIDNTIVTDSDQSGSIFGLSSSFVLKAAVSSDILVQSTTQVRIMVEIGCTRTLDTYIEEYTVG